MQCKEVVDNRILWLLSMEKNEVNKIGNIWGYNTKTTDFAGNVFDIFAISPTLTTMSGGGRMPHIVEVKYE